MYCSRCLDIHVGASLGRHDGGVAFGLGNCRKGGEHKWAKGRFIAPAPLMMVYGRYTLRAVSVEATHEWRKIGPVVSVVPIAAIAYFLEMVLQIPVPYEEGVQFLLDPGDEALVPMIGGKERITIDRLRERGLVGIEWRLGLMKRLD